MGDLHMTISLGSVRRYSGLISLLVILGVTIIAVNPLREFSYVDDWVYALMVRHTLATGQYQLHIFATTNLPFLVYWGATFSKILGYSFATIRVSTVVLSVVAVIALYALGREHGFDDWKAALISLAFVICPPVLILSFTFMTEIPFIACTVVALACYTRAIRSGSRLWMLLGAAAAACAILTRQFGVAFIPALGAVWLAGSNRRATLPFYLIGGAFPLAAAVAMVSLGLIHPNWVQDVVFRLQRAYLAGGGALIVNSLWRVMMTLEYMALFSLPVGVVALIDFFSARQRAQQDKRAARLNLAIFGSVIVFNVAMSLVGMLALGQPGIMPYVPWDVHDITSVPLWVLLSLTVLTTILSGLLVLLIARRHIWAAEPLSPAERLIDWWALCMFTISMPYYQLGDRYVLGLLPYVLIVLGRAIKGWPGRWRWPSLTVGIALLLASGLWVRGTISALEAQWQAAESLRARGVDVHQIIAAREWNAYYGAFDEYLADRGYSLDASYGDYTGVWLRARLATAEYTIPDPRYPEQAPSGWQAVGGVPYFDTFLQLRTATIFRRPR
jgi:4-amino-4-deoxy-L-arabinose transferase-like glycosyltransferase